MSFDGRAPRDRFDKRGRPRAPWVEGRRFVRLDEITAWQPTSHDHICLAYLKRRQQVAIFSDSTGISLARESAQFEEPDAPTGFWACKIVKGAFTPYSKLPDRKVGADQAPAVGGGGR